MLSNENSTISTDLLTPSAEALALLRLDYLQSLHNKLEYARPTEAERDFLLSEISRIEDEQIMNGHQNPNDNV